MKRHGVFYTPEAIAQYLVSRVGITGGRVLDPSCGEGVFLKCVPSNADCVGVDIDPIAIKTARQQLPQAHLILGSLFDQQLEPFDFIIGNPPYITEVRGQKALFQSLPRQYYSPKMDLADAFFHWSLDHLKPGGKLAFVLPAYWLQRAAAQNLRERVWRECRFEELWVFDEHKLFADAPGHHSSLVILTKHARENLNTSDACTIGKPYATGPSTDDLVSGEVTLFNGKFRMGERNVQQLLQKMTQGAWYLKVSEIQQGVILPSSEAFFLEQPDLPYACLKPFYSAAALKNNKPSAWLIYGDATFKENIDHYPTLKAHLDGHASRNTSSNAPYGLHRPRQKHWFESNTPRLYAPRQVERPLAYLISETAYVNEGVNIIQPNLPEGWTIEKLQATLTSALAWFWFYHHNRKGTRLQIDKADLVQFPIQENYNLTQREEEILEDFLGRMDKKRCTDSAAKVPCLTQSSSETPVM